MARSLASQEHPQACAPRMQLAFLNQAYSPSQQVLWPHREEPREAHTSLDKNALAKGEASTTHRQRDRHTGYPNIKKEREREPGRSQALVKDKQTGSKPDRQTHRQRDQLAEKASE